MTNNIPLTFTAIQSFIGGLTLALFVVCIAAKTALLRKRGVRAMVFGRTDKSDFFLIPVILAIVYAALARSLGLPMLDFLLMPFWTVLVLGWIGLALCILAATGFILTLAGFGDSFRVGIDAEKPPELVTGGMFAISRNPIYLCFLFLLAGLFLIHRNILIAVAVAIFTAAIHRQVIREEKFLEAHYGEEYLAYRKKVRRYL